MNNVLFRRALGVCAVAALVTSALPLASASAVPVGRSLTATSHDGLAFDLADYTAGDITVQVTDSSAGAVDVDDSQDLTYSWSVTPFAPNAMTLQVPTTGSSAVATETNGRFVVPLPIEQGPGEYVLTAGLDAGTTTLPVSSHEILRIRTGNAAPAGSTAAITGLGSSTPGLAQDGTLTVLAPDDTYGTDAGTAPDPVVGQVYSLTVDHGFFTTGQGPLAPAVGDMAGNLDQLGTKLTGVTDVDGQIDFMVGIARDGGFDDDGKVTATVSVAGGLPGAAGAAWDTKEPLNGHVALTLSPAGEQDGPVNPALAGDRTFYDVFTLDQFGNRVGGVPVELEYTGNTDDYDYSDDDTDSDFDTFGDIWVTSFEAGTITITGTWAEAPTYLYNTAGQAVADVRDVTGSITSSTYEGNFKASSFSMTSSISEVVKVGTSVTQTVRVIDQLGNPVRGYQVQYFRDGPDHNAGDVVATRSTNAQGEAAYTFVGTKRGRAKITAEVTDGTNRRLLTGSAVFGATIKARLVKGKGGSGADRLQVSANKLAAGAQVRVYRVLKGKRYAVGAKKLNRKGAVVFTIRDRNRNARTTYVAVVHSTSKSVADQSNTVKLR